MDRLMAVVGILANLGMFAWCGIAPIVAGAMALKCLGEGTFLGVLKAIGCGCFAGLGIIWAQGYMDGLKKAFRMLRGKSDPKNDQDDAT